MKTCRSLIPALVPIGLLLFGTGCATDPGEVIGPAGPATLQELIVSTQLVIEGTVESLHALPADPSGLVPHYAEVNVTKVVRGDAVDLGNTITVLDGGGYTRGGQVVRGQSGPPFNTGDHVLLFLNPPPDGSATPWKYAPLPGSGRLGVSSDRELDASGYDQLTHDLAKRYDADQLEELVRTAPVAVATSEPG